MHNFNRLGLIARLPNNNSNTTTVYKCNYGEWKTHQQVPNLKKHFKDKNVSRDFELMNKIVYINKFPVSRDDI